MYFYGVLLNWEPSDKSQITFPCKIWPAYEHGETAEEVSSLESPSDMSVSEESKMLRCWCMGSCLTLGQ